jgi:hypothetical protein
VVDLWQTISRLYAPNDGIKEHDPIPDLQILCLGLGKPFSDRSAQIQLALLLELSARLQQAIAISAFDPASDEGDRKIYEQFGITYMEENLVSYLGSYEASSYVDRWVDTSLIPLRHIYCLCLTALEHCTNPSYIRILSPHWPSIHHASSSETTWPSISALSAQSPKINQRSSLPRMNSANQRRSVKERLDTLHRKTESWNA